MIIIKHEEHEMKSVKNHNHRQIRWCPVRHCPRISKVTPRKRAGVNSKAIRRTRRGKGVDLQLTTTRGSRSLRKKRSRERDAAAAKTKRREVRGEKLNCPIR